MKNIFHNLCNVLEIFLNHIAPSFGCESFGGTLFMRSNPLNLSLPLYNCKGFDCRSYLNGLVVFSTFFNLSLNFARGDDDLSHNQLEMLFFLTM